MPPGGAPAGGHLAGCGAGHRRVLEHCLCGHRGPWVTWALGDLAVKLALGVALLLPFRLFIGRQLAQRAA